MTNEEAVILGIIPAHSREEKDILINHLKSAIRKMMAMAGHPDAGQGCRNVISCGKDAIREHGPLSNRVPTSNAPMDTSWIVSGMVCAKCNSNLIVCQAFEPSADYWWYCSDKCCENHHPGVQLGDQTPCSFAVNWYPNPE